MTLERATVRRDATLKLLASVTPDEEGSGEAGRRRARRELEERGAGR